MGMDYIETSARLPWAGRFSQVPPCTNGYESCILYVMRRSTEEGRWKVSQQTEFLWPNERMAFTRAEQMVDYYLTGTYQAGMTAEELMEPYRREGPDPYVRHRETSLDGAATDNSRAIVSDQPGLFNAWGYAETACRRICGEEVGEPSLSLALWRGRYHEYDRERMESQALTGRRVRLVRDHETAHGRLPADAEGVIRFYGRTGDPPEIDFSKELPVEFHGGISGKALRPLRINPPDLPADRAKRIVIPLPYDALEFVESDSDFIEKSTSKPYPPANPKLPGLSLFFRCPNEDKNV